MRRSSNRAANKRQTRVARRIFKISTQLRRLARAVKP